MLPLPWVPTYGDFLFLIIAHHSALQINVFTLTHRGDEHRPQRFYESVTRTLQICLGVQNMKRLGLFHVPEGGDFGILWPLLIAAKELPPGELRRWVIDLLSTWPREGMTVSSPSDIY